MYAGYSPEKFTEKSARDTIGAAKGQLEKVVVVLGYRSSTKRPYVSPSSSTSPPRIPAVQKGKNQVVHSSSSNLGQSRGIPQEGSKENPAPGDSRLAKRRKSDSSSLGEPGREILSACQDEMISSVDLSGRWVMDFTPERYQLSPNGHFCFPVRRRKTFRDARYTGVSRKAIGGAVRSKERPRCDIPSFLSQGWVDTGYSPGSSSI
ncbi:hypothetical protein C8J56DRAFT_286429 [Mycena floridula]|nr:hypothetical protein C8J56DRAFT_286429 [Mycena floridula]